MTLNEMIPQRRSVRSYLPDELPATTLAALGDFAAALKPLLPTGNVAHRFIRRSDATLLQRWRTPHFLAIFTDGTDDGLLNAGYMFQQFDLHLQAQGLGSCWVGLGSLNDGVPVPDGMKLAVLMAIGVPDGVALRAGGEAFNRKALADIADIPDTRLEPLRLAPSATNSQPWYVTHQGDALHLWRTVWGPIRQRTLGRLNKLDMGIGLAHLHVAHREGFRFMRMETPPALDGYVYVGTVHL